MSELDAVGVNTSVDTPEPAPEYLSEQDLQLSDAVSEAEERLSDYKSIDESVRSPLVISTSKSVPSYKMQTPTKISRIPTPGRRKSANTTPSPSPNATNKLGITSRITPRALNKKVERVGIASDMTPQAAAENEHLPTLETRCVPSAFTRIRSDGGSGLNRTISNSSLCSNAGSVVSVSSLTRSKNKPPKSDARMSSRLGVSSRNGARKSTSLFAPIQSMTHKIWPTAAPDLTVVPEDFTLSEQAVMALKEDHEVTEKGVQELLSYVSSSSSSMALTTANLKARKEETMLLKAGLRRLTTHSQGLMRCCETLERRTLDVNEYVDASKAEIERLSDLLRLQNTKQTEGIQSELEFDDINGDGSLSRPLSDTETASTSSSQNIFPRHSSQEADRQRQDFQLAMQEDSPLSAYVRNVLKKATDKIEDKWRTRFAEQLVEHEQALAQERERSSASVLSSSRLVTETLHGKDDELKAIQELNINLNQQIRQMELDLDATRSERDFFKQQMEDDDERSSSAHSFWEKTTDLAKQNRNLTEDLSQANNTIVRLNETINIMKSKASSLKTENGDRVRASKSMVAERNLLQDKLTAMEAKFEDEKNRREQFQVNVEQLTVENTALYAQMVALQTTYEAKMEEMQVQHEKRNISLAGEIKLLQDQNRLIRKSEPKHHLESYGSSGTSVSATGCNNSVTPQADTERSFQRIQELTNDLLEARRELLEKDNLIDELQSKITEGELMRRKLHNTIQELRGNIRVHVRLRPFLRSDGPEAVAENPESAIMCDTFASSITTNVETPHTFAFDKIYGQSDSQEVVFKDVSQFIQSAMDGYNVCIFAYGQTGSGKTHTMQGSGKAQMRGIIPRSIDHIINCCEELTAMGWNFSLMVTFYEIYNETIRDLLSMNNGSDVKHNIRTDNRGRNYVDGLTEVYIDFDQAAEQVDEIVNLAACNRSVDRTDMNAHSSRSHSIFALKIRGYNEAQNTEVEGTLSLVDLAGSERLSRSRATGERLKEAQAINKSLSALADVFQALAKKSSHVPYRNSKLTYALQPALSGEGKTLMMANLSPTYASLDESLCSMRFAQKVSQCELGAPVRQIKSTRRQSMGPGDLTRNGIASSSPRENRRSTLTPGMLRKLV
ncbi:kinesin-like protein [Plasmopara halstedii]|uniref:Kinesin-like protein n=1 Tax=Plasmopara halstedii TaxID=4781 RepID=A0A0P1A7E0_PLAHL|nr:kinesin-like protein [Plasmopara halstedii]CEG36535.1 kinesin-like protein [Plasmopara halstedii]|eukprot:XP_024572904.1 kinesin-like protein [Plasmopara halstedii]